MMIQIHQKSIPIAQLQHRLVQGESNIENVVFFVPSVPNIDISELIFTIKLLAEDAGKIVVGELDTDPTENGILLSWDVAKKYTRYGGSTRLQIDGADATGNVVYRALSEKFCMRKELTGEDAAQDPEPDPEAGYVPPIEPGDNGKYLRAMNGKAVWESLKQTGGGGVGNNGATFIPSVSEEGVISWTNDGDLPNPEPVNIKGVPGKPGDNYVLTEADKAEIAKKAAVLVDLPTALPNPHALTFTGAVEGTYDGSEPKEIKIPEAKEYTLPAASEAALGGVKAPAKTEDMTQPVGIGEDGFLFTKAGTSGGSNNLNSVRIANVTTTEEVTDFLFEFDKAEYSDLYIYMYVQGTTTNEENYNKNVEIGFNHEGKNQTTMRTLFGTAIQRYGKWCHGHVVFLKDCYFIQSSIAGSNKAFNTEKTMWTQFDNTIHAGGLETIRIRAGGGTVFGVGTELIIIGVPA